MASAAPSGGAGAGAGATAAASTVTPARRRGASSSRGAVSLDDVFADLDPTLRRTKITCTIGPACNKVDTLVKMIEAGMTTARLNFSHGDHESHLATLKNIRLASERTKTAVAVMLDTKGPEIRTGFLADHKAIELKAGQDLEIVTDYSFLGNTEKIACSYKSLPKSVEVGNTILAADGELVMKVKEVKAESIIVEVTNDATLGERKNMNLPGVIVDLPTVTAKDADDLENFGAKHGVDFVAASFVRKGSDIDTIRDVLGPRGRHIKIIAKIENQEGLHNYDDILAKTDGVMVARGDMGMEIPPYKVFLAQKMMINKANMAGKPVVTATQMLDSMIKHPRPTRAECTDVANAVIDGSDSVMLSGETAGGLYPVKAVQMMAAICLEAESIIDYNSKYSEMRLAMQGSALSVAEVVASSAVKTALDLGAALIIVCTETGNTARLIAKYTPNIPILALTAEDFVARQCFGLYKGVTARLEGSMIGTSRLLQIAALKAKERGLVQTGDYIVTVHGTIEGRPGTTNMCKVVQVE